MVAILKGATSQSIYLEVLDSASTTGGRKTGIAFNAAGLTAYYARNGAAATAITLVTQTAAGAYSSGGWVEVDATNMPGVYRLDIPNAALASGVDSVVVTVKGAAGMVQVSKEIQLTSINLQDAAAMGLSRLDVAITTRMPNVTADNGTAQAGGASTVTLRAGASAVDNFYNWQIVAITGGTGAGQARLITGYVGSTKVATVDRAWATNPDATSTYYIVPMDKVQVILNDDKTGYTASTVSDKTGYSLANNAVDAAQFTQAAADKVWSSATRTLTALGASLVQEIWDRATSALTTAGSIGKLLVDNINATISSRLASASYTAPPTAAAISTQVWTEPVPGTFPAGSAGAKLNSASAAGDPWGTAVPGAYGAGTAGNILGNRLDVAVSSRASGAVGGVVGSGSKSWPITVTKPDGVTPIEGVAVWITTDAAGTNAVAGTIYTDTLGRINTTVGFMLDPGAYYLWRQHGLYNFANPTSFTVT